MEHVPVPDASDRDREIIGNLARQCCSIGDERYKSQMQLQQRLLKTFGEAPNGQSLGVLNQKALNWWEQSLSQLGAALKTSFKLPASPFANPRTADEWEPYLVEKQAGVAALARTLADAETEINERVYRLFNLTADEIALLQKEVEH